MTRDDRDYVSKSRARRRALVLADINETGGTGTYFKRLLLYLGRRYSVHVVLKSEFRTPGVERMLAGTSAEVSFDFTLFPRLEDALMRICRRLRILLYYFLVRDSLIRFRLERRYRPDLFVISQGGAYGYLPFLIGSKPVMLILHGTFESPITRSLGGALYTRLYRQRMLRNKLICAVSEYAKRGFQKYSRSRALAERTIHIWNWAELPVLREGTRGRSELVVLTMGHLIEYKNPVLWVDVAKRITERYPGAVRFIWAGDGSMLPELRRSIEGYIGIEFAGYVEDTRGLYASAGIYFQPSSIENHSISVIEAMANGLPCVVSRVGGMTESIEDGKEGFVLDAFDVDGYSEAISELICSEEKRIEMGLRAREKAETLFSRDRWNEEMDRAIAGIIGPSART
jgi:glycosyltransferase involved in cell wall biosynthesis